MFFIVVILELFVLSPPKPSFEMQLTYNLLFCVFVTGEGFTESWVTDQEPLLVGYRGDIAHPFIPHFHLPYCGIVVSIQGIEKN